jgi:hypothetical protein
MAKKKKPARTVAAVAPKSKARESHPGRSFAIIEQTALKAAQLTTRHWSVLQPRLAVDPRPTLLAKSPELKGAITVQSIRREQSKTATHSQNSELTQGVQLVTALRGAITMQKAPKVLRRLYGVGVKMAANSVTSVRSAIKLILERHAQTNAGAELAPYGVVEDDFTNLAQADQQIAAADASQERMRATAPLGTRERNRIAHEMLDLIAKVAGAGLMAFATDGETRKEFQDLSAAGARGQKQLQAEGGGTGNGQGPTVPEARTPP